MTLTKLIDVVVKSRFIPIDEGLDMCVDTHG